jgi:two-component system, NtrC family, response regulator HydG
VDLENLPTTELSRSDSPSSLGFVLVVVDGPDRGKRFVLDPADGCRFLVGQSPACAIQLTDRTVSRRHLALDLDGPDLNLTDLGSTNGTEVEAPRVHVGKVRLDGGEIVRLGSTTLRIEREVGPDPSSVDARARFGRFVGESPAMRALYPLCERLAASDIPVIIEGETGTGKEVLAECLHEQSPRASGPFVVFDCTAVPPTLVESELFGHEKGAFTGATTTRKGVFEEAHGGTLLIDEIGDLEMALQAKLLRALERGEVRRVGANRFIKVDVRVIAATRRDLDRAVQEGTFRDDLFHRLAVGRIELPPLRRRTGDIEVLAAHFAQLIGKTTLPPHVVSAWKSLSWPGNARELRNAVARYLALGDLAPIGGSMPSAPEPTEPAETEKSKNGDLVEEILEKDWPLVRAREHLVREFEQRYVARVLAQHGGVVTHAAAASGIARRHFQRLRARSPLPKE